MLLFYYLKLFNLFINLVFGAHTEEKAEECIIHSFHVCMLGFMIFMYACDYSSMGAEYDDDDDNNINNNNHNSERSY